ncbi:hypothetical protein ACQKDS_02480 [Serratia sp. NPDC078593]|uniref:hypothetical protein n=1 Tax=unclassified Serratia (in: enterobacteria) TaxID=2647522 RepID=UPI0037CE3ECC
MKTAYSMKWALLGMLLLLSACRAPAPTPAGKAVVGNPQAQVEQEAKRLQQCQQELGVLNSLKTKDYQATQQTFDQLMGNAAQYASLRNKVNGETQGTVDALYHYKVSLLCAEINQAVLLHLAQHEGRSE